MRLWHQYLSREYLESLDVGDIPCVVFPYTRGIKSKTGKPCCNIWARERGSHDEVKYAIALCMLSYDFPKAMQSLPEKPIEDYDIPCADFFCSREGCDKGRSCAGDHRVGSLFYPVREHFQSKLSQFDCAALLHCLLRRKTSTPLVREERKFCLSIDRPSSSDESS